jgi:enterochelin esterase-like enzyme
MKNLSLILLTLIVSLAGNAQKYLGYSDDSLNIDSEFLKESIRLNLHLPETQAFASETTRYPVTIVFDSQHERTYPHIINCIDLLTNDSQMPENIIVGVPFDMNNRYYYTSAQMQEGDSLSGIERIEKFIFGELIPLLREEYKAGDFLTLVGHSRTGFLVNYLTVKHSKDINLAIALSGFFDNKPLSVKTFQEFIVEPENFPHPLHYYAMAGTTLEEETYAGENMDVATYTDLHQLPQNFKATFGETSNANHMTNLWLSIPPILVDAYADYNSVLDTWFYIKLKGEPLENPVEEFEADLRKAGTGLGGEFNPGLTQIFSIASHYAYSEEDFQKAIDFMLLGQKYYPEYLDFDLELIGFYRQLGETEKAEEAEVAFKSKLEKRSDLSEKDRLEMLKYLDN